MKYAIKIFKAVSNEKRIKILRLLNKYAKLSVSQISDKLEMTLITVSRHLEKLRAVDLVNFQREGAKIYYSLAKPKNFLVKTIFNLLWKI